MLINSTTTLLGIENVNIDRVEETMESINVHLSTKVNSQCCPACKNETRSVHDYRIQKVKDICFRGKTCFLYLKKRRYVCQFCRKRFYEKYDFIERYSHHSKRLIHSFLTKVKDMNFKLAAKETGIAHTTGFKWFDRCCQYENKGLPVVLAIDEFCGHTGREKYQCVIGDPYHRDIYDIIPNRKLSTLKEYFSKYDVSNVKIVVMDMWKPYKTLVESFGNDSIIVVDKFHYVRHNFWALERVRKRVQKEFSDKERKIMKRSRYILHKSNSDLSEDERVLLVSYFELSEDLRVAYQIKEMFFEWFYHHEKSNARERLHDLYHTIESSHLREYRYMVNTFKNWEDEIINSFLYPFTNGFLEGKNNRIKVIKRMSYGFRNFERFRNKILSAIA